MACFGHINTNVLRTDYESISFEFRIDEKIVKSIINDFDLDPIINLVGSFILIKKPYLC
jgi:hypothetical protein